MTIAVLGALFTQTTDLLAEAAEKSSRLSSYDFIVDFDVQGTGPKQHKIEGNYHSDYGLYLKIGEIQVARRGQKVAYRRKDRSWALTDPEGKRTIKAPHEEVQGLRARFQRVEAGPKEPEVESPGAEGEGSAVFSGELTPQGARDLLPSHGMLRKIENLELSGSGRAWVSEERFVIRYEIKIQASGLFRDADFSVTFTRRVSLKKLNRAESQMPEEARKLLQ